jgi:hypothetical protein
MNEENGKPPRSARLMADDDLLQKEFDFQQLSKKWSDTHTEQDVKLIVELKNKGHSFRCIARNLPGPPDESVVRALKNGVKSITKRKQKPKKAVTAKESNGGLPDQPARSAEPTSPQHPDEKGAPKQATVLPDSTEQTGAVVRAPAATQAASAKKKLSPAELQAEVERRVSEDLTEKIRKEVAFRERCAKSKGNFLDHLRRDPIV